MVENGENSTSERADTSESQSEDFGHPRGTLVIVLVYGLLFALVWIGLYVFEFLPRGAPTP